MAFVVSHGTIAQIVCDPCAHRSQIDDTVPESLGVRRLAADEVAPLYPCDECKMPLVTTEAGPEAK